MRREEAKVTCPLGAFVPEEVHGDAHQPRLGLVGHGSASKESHQRLLRQVGGKIWIAAKAIQIAEKPRKL
jgi:hypothetical protein